MKARFGLMLCCLAIGIVGCGSSSTTAPAGSPDSKGGGDNKGGGGKIVGKWAPQGDEAQLFPEGSYMELTADGKILMLINIKGGKGPVEIGTYKVEGDKITKMAKKNGKDDNETNTIKSLTDDELVMVEPDGKEAKFKRMK